MVRYRKLGYVELNVTDIERSTAFYTDLVGLELVGDEPEGARKFRCSEADHAIILHPASSAGLKCVGWMLEGEEQVPVLQERLDEAGVPWEEVGGAELVQRGLGRAIRIVEPCMGSTIEFYVGEKGGEGSFSARHAKIQRLGHVVLKGPDHRRAVAFFRDVLNFRESDSVDGSVTFMRCFPNPYHHGIGLAEADERGFHHLNFMVTELDDVGRAFNRFKTNGVPIVYGPGRHPISTSVFIYFLDPDGLTLEYSFGMEEFPEIQARPPRVLERRPENSDAWGGRPTPGFAEVGALEAARIA